MSRKVKAEPLPDSDSELGEEEDEKVRERIRSIKNNKLEARVPSKRFTGGVIIDSEVETSASTSLSAAEKKGLIEVEELERELDLKNTFSRETNKRDEDAEMNKYIDEQIRLRREAAKKEQRSINDSRNTDQDEFSDLFTMSAEGTDKIDDILLHSLSKHLAPTPDERSEAMLSSQMLNGIPEVDLGVGERIRAIEATEEAKLKMTSRSSKFRSYKSTPWSRR